MSKILTGQAKVESAFTTLNGQQTAILKRAGYSK